MNKNVIKAALDAAQRRISHYNEVQRIRSLGGKGTAVDNRVDAEVLGKIDNALRELNRRDSPTRSRTT